MSQHIQADKNKKDIVFCHLEKCAGTYIAKMLELWKKKTGKNYYWLGHNVDGRAIKQMQNVLICGNIRNPYSYYVSLWAFSGIHKKGHYQLFASKYPQYLYLYKDSNNIQHFRKWLKLMLSPASASISIDTISNSSVNCSTNSPTNSSCNSSSPTTLLPLDKTFSRQNQPQKSILQIDGNAFEKEDFAKHMVKHKIGLHTSRFFELYNQSDFNLLNDIAANPMVQQFIRVENLKEDLAKIGVPYENKVRNRSKHRPIAAYYGKEEIELVYKLDNYIFKKFGYSKELPMS